MRKYIVVACIFVAIGAAIWVWEQYFDNTFTLSDSDSTIPRSFVVTVNAVPVANDQERDEIVLRRALEFWAFADLSPKDIHIEYLGPRDEMHSYLATDIACASSEGELAGGELKQSPYHCQLSIFYMEGDIDQTKKQMKANAEKARSLME